LPKFTTFDACSQEGDYDEHGIRIPTIEEPWTKDEFMAALDTLKESGEFEYALDVNAGSTGEWWPYAYSPMLQSFGGDLIDRSTYTSAEGVLNGPEALAWGEWFQSLFTEGYAPATPADDQGFLQGRIPLWYTGSWSAQTVLDTYGDDALFLPPPDFGNGPKIGAGSWQMGVTTNLSRRGDPRRLRVRALHNDTRKRCLDVRKNEPDSQPPRMPQP
jgi:multiple sugar transport system substrate-binding protein